jgi:hypothetical protein
MEVMSRNTATKILAEATMPSLSLTDRENILLSDWWCIQEDSQDFARLPQAVQETMQAYEVPPDPDNAIYDALLLQSLIDEYIGVKNEYLAQRMSLLGYQDIFVEGEKEILFPCRCCGYETLSRYGEYDICPVCFWEDTGVQNPEQYSGPNHMTLAEARENYIKIGACCESAVPFVDKEGPLKYPRSVDGQEK